jgi:hypothetical protein
MFMQSKNPLPRHRFMRYIVYMEHQADHAWAERELPTSQVSGLDQSGVEYAEALRQANGDPRDQEFVDWVNSYHLGLQKLLRLNRTARLLNSTFRAVDLEELSGTVANITGSPRFPTSRILVSNTSNDRVLRAARQVHSDLLPGRGHRDTKVGTYFPLLSAVRINWRNAEAYHPATLAHDIGDLLAQAALATTINVHVQYEPEPAARNWYGYQYRSRNQYFGQWIHKAATEKIASLSRTGTGWTTELLGDTHPDLAPYLLPVGFRAESVGAVALDLIASKAGLKETEHGNELLQAIVSFGKTGGDSSAHDAVEEITTRAGGSRQLLAELEAAPFNSNNFNVDLLQYVEETLNIDASRRPSHAFRQFTDA